MTDSWGDDADSNPFDSSAVNQGDLDWAAVPDHTTSNTWESNNNDDWSSEPDKKKKKSDDTALSPTGWEEPEPEPSSKKSRWSKEKADNRGGWYKKTTVDKNISPPTSVTCARRFHWTCCGVPFYIHYSWFILLAIMIAMCFKLSKPFEKLIATLILFVLIFFSIIFHELAHVLMGKIFGGYSVYIVSVPMGGQHFIEHNMGSLGHFCIALAGPISHIPQIALWYEVSKMMLVKLNMGDDVLNAMWYWQGDLGLNVSLGMLRISIQLMVLNLIVPAWPLDGSVITAQLLQCCLSLKRTGWTMLWINLPIGVSLIVVGFLYSFGLAAYVGIWVLWQSFRLWRCLWSGDESKLQKYGPFVLKANSISGSTVSV